MLNSAHMDLLEELCALSPGFHLITIKKDFVLDIKQFNMLDCLDFSYSNNRTFVDTHYHSFICFK